MARITPTPPGPFSDMVRAINAHRSNGKVMGIGLTPEQMNRLENDPTLYGLVYLFRALKREDYSTPPLFDPYSPTVDRIRNAVSRAAQENRLK